MLRDFLAALSFANLCYLRIWSETLTYKRSDTYLMTTPPRPVEYIALMVNVLLLALVLWGLGLLAQCVLTKKTIRFAEMAVVVGLCIPLNAMRSVLANQFPYLRSPLIELLGVNGVILLGAALAICGLAITVFYHRAGARVAIVILAGLSPFCAVTFAQGILKIARYDATEYANKPPAPMIPQTGNLHARSVDHRRRVGLPAELCRSRRHTATPGTGPVAPGSDFFRSRQSAGFGNAGVDPGLLRRASGGSRPQRRAA